VSDDVLAKLLKARSGTTLTDRRDTALLRTFIDTGCRLSEVTNLTQGDVNIGDATITVRGKGDRERTVAIGDKALKAIDVYVRHLERERPEAIADDRPLWVSRTGAGMTTSGVTNALHVMCADAGVPRLHWHLFRHTMAHNWLSSGGQEGDLMEHAGWRSRSMLDIYARATKAERAQAAARRLALGDRV
jgi:site-specific recombinase XerD